RRAVLGFHAARSIDQRGRIYAEPEASKAVHAAYPEPIRSWISRHGGLTSRMLLLRGRELAAIYPSCRQTIFLLPLWEKVARIDRCATDEGSLSAFPAASMKASIRGNRPLTPLRCAKRPSPTRGEGKSKSPHISDGQFTIQGMPNWSVHIP